ncbi:TetR/AcrR family transcriptional regulator [Chitinimonas arctica]|uniref:TetR/AcrR family transcriptional regulator n=1 Tax=Chitinimonas arctica TaxID=2594795 RepID=A0A516SB46_9NEIS|nr:TetR/AcrR family transcriptional regulator [Chitinimonas arctica]QDQ25366.1 TetR/AcrR family transcriptional regulator [Chitinimonas arctica]
MNRSATPASIELDTQEARQRALLALRGLTAGKSAGEVNYGEIAAAAGLPWQTVKRLLGPRDGFAALLNGAAPEPVDTRDRILDAAARIFAQKSYQGASLDEVAADAGLTKGAVYWHFKSKSDLFFALLDSRFQQEYDEHLPEALAHEATHADPKEGLKAVLGSVVGRVKDDPDWPRLFLEFMGQARDPDVRQRLASAYQDAWRMSAGLIAHQHQLRGQTPPADPELLAIFWSALMDGLIISWLVNPERIQLDTLMPRLVDMLWRGLEPQSHDSPKE